MQCQYVRSCIYVHSSPAIHWIRYFPTLLEFAHFEGFFNNHEEYSKISHLPGTCGSFELIPEMLQIMEDRLQENDEATLMQLQKLLKDHGHDKSRSTVIRAQRNLIAYNVLRTVNC